VIFRLRRRELLLRLDWRQKNNADQQEKKCPSFSHTHVPALMRRLVADTTLSSVLRTVLTMLAILAGVTRVGTCAGRRENVERNLIEEKNRQNNLRKDHKES
jgi:hypothetical protein